MFGPADSYVWTTLAAACITRGMSPNEASDAADKMLTRCVQNAIGVADLRFRVNEQVDILHEKHYERKEAYRKAKEAKREAEEAERKANEAVCQAGVSGQAAAALRVADEAKSVKKATPAAKAHSGKRFRKVVPR